MSCILLLQVCNYIILYWGVTGYINYSEDILCADMKSAAISRACQNVVTQNLELKRWSNNEHLEKKGGALVLLSYLHKKKTGTKFNAPYIESAFPKIGIKNR